MILKIKEMLYAIILLEALLFLHLFHSSRPIHMIEIMHLYFRGTRRIICFSGWELWVHSLLHLLQFKVLGFNFALICTFSSFISFLLISLYHCDASWTRTRETSLIHLLPSTEGLELVNLITTDERSNWGTVGKIEYFLKNKNYLEFVFYQTTICLWL